MKFISINNDISVRKEEIIAVERTENGLARVVMENISYDTNFPYETILQILEIPDIEEKIKENMSLPEAYHRPSIS